MANKKPITDEDELKELEMRMDQAWRTWDKTFDLLWNKETDHVHVLEIMSLAIEASKSYFKKRNSIWDKENTKYKSIF